MKIDWLQDALLAIVSVLLIVDIVLTRRAFRAGQDALKRLQALARRELEKNADRP